MKDIIRSCVLKKNAAAVFVKIFITNSISIFSLLFIFSLSSNVLADTPLIDKDFQLITCDVNQAKKLRFEQLPSYSGRPYMMCRLKYLINPVNPFEILNFENDTFSIHSNIFEGVFVSILKSTEINCNNHRKGTEGCRLTEITKQVQQDLAFFSLGVDKTGLYLPHDWNFNDLRIGYFSRKDFSLKAENAHKTLLDALKRREELTKHLINSRSFAEPEYIAIALAEINNKSILTSLSNYYEYCENNCKYSRSFIYYSLLELIQENSTETEKLISIIQALPEQLAISETHGGKTELSRMYDILHLNRSIKNNNTDLALSIIKKLVKYGAPEDLSDEHSFSNEENDDLNEVSWLDNIDQNMSENNIRKYKSARQAYKAVLFIDDLLFLSQSLINGPSIKKEEDPKLAYELNLWKNSYVFKQIHESIQNQIRENLNNLKVFIRGEEVENG